MKTTIYWAMQHSRDGMNEFRFRITYWWLNQQVEFLEWRLRHALAQKPFTFNDSRLTADFSTSCQASSEGGRHALSSL